MIETLWIILFLLALLVVLVVVGTFSLLCITIPYRIIQAYQQAKRDVELEEILKERKESR